MSINDIVIDTKDEHKNFGEPVDIGRPCYHCGEPVPDSLSLYVEIDNEERAMCCIGCQAVAVAIMDYGLADYYKFRKENGNKPDELIPEQLRHLAIYDDPGLQEDLVESNGGKLKSTSLLLVDMTCPACVWLIESRLSRLAGVSSINVNYSTQRAQVQWDDSVIHLSDLLKCIVTLGYKARPYDVSQAHKQLDAEQKYQLRRLGLAAVLGMQVMMLSVALYVGDWSGMEQNYRYFFHWVCLLLTTPVIFYSAQSFFTRAWRDLKLFRTGMDVPVSLGILIAYVHSVWATLSFSGHVYYDSIVMFVFFLLSARYFEFRARRQSALYVDTLAQLIPAIATKLTGKEGDYEQETVAVTALQAGDILLIRPGDVIPTDGYLLDGETTVDESLLTGESKPVLKSFNELLIGGSSNIEQPVKMRVSRIGKDTMCSHIYRLMEQGQRIKPELLALSNRVSAWFVFTVLMLAALTAWYWILHDASLWVPITISVLVVSCPCALSLATPVALAAASTGLMKEGVVLVNANAIEALNKVTSYVFDKTGTLTSDSFSLTKTTLLAPVSEKQCIAIASAIEANSAHPVAKAFACATQGKEKKHAVNIRNHVGAGITAEVDAIRYFLGTEKFIQQQTGLTLDLDTQRANVSVASTYVLLANAKEIQCIFILEDNIRDGAKELIEFLESQNKSITVLSGDNRQATAALANELYLNNVFDSQSPDQKMSHIMALQKNGESVAMIGDGANDAPVLACANVSIAMGDGTALASTNADLILLNSRLDKLIAVINLAAATKTVIQQNLSWAIFYNVVALPLAVMGLITPWMAAIGMSLSSLLVVINSSRLSQKKI